MSDSDSWCTPPAVATPLLEFFGGPVDCDPCSNAKSIIKADRAYTAGGLHLPWGGWRVHRGGVAKTAYANHPYSKSALWIDKGIHELEDERVTELLYLCMAATSTAWWVKAMTHPGHPRARVIFTKRLAFLDPRPRKVRGKEQRGMKTASARFEPALIYYGRRVKSFEREFQSITSWVSWGR